MRDGRLSLIERSESVCSVRNRGVSISSNIQSLVFARGVADAGEGLVDSKLLEWLRFGAASWRGGRDGLLLECGDLDCCVFMEDGGGSGRLKGEVALAPGLVLKRFGGLLRPIFLIGLDPVLRGWWLSALVNASWLEVSSAPKSGPTDGALLLLRRRRMTCVFGIYSDGSLQQYKRSYAGGQLDLVSLLLQYNYENPTKNLI
jgi:hypothetical protein